MAALSSAIRSAPVPHDRERAGDVVAMLPETLRCGPLGDAVFGTAGSSPYLARLLRQHGLWLADAAERSAEETLDSLIATIPRDTGAPPEPEPGQALRETKARVALIVGLADLGGVWSVDQVTRALSRFADAVLSRVVRDLIRAEVDRGTLPEAATPDDPCGYVVLAMGKHGAGELNYSSDIDLIALFDDSRFAPDRVMEARAVFIRITKRLVTLLSAQTSAGYVFRTDMRLRPSPSTTPVCIAMDAAEQYYESIGRTWERAAHIKARPVAGDIAAGRAYLDRLRPFVWRRYLDFATVEDTRETLGKIRAHKGAFTVGSLPGHDVKLGPGGIREIEFFVQTRQLICGGRDASLRDPTTLGALDALVEAGWVVPDARDALAQDYRAHRTLEHRLQMVEDAQTHTYPTEAHARERIAALSGTDDLAAFERDLADRLNRVYATTEDFFGGETHAATAPGEALAGDPKVARWRDGKIAATRSARAQALYRRLEPRILHQLAGAADPDDALTQFDRFLSGLPYGVQVFSLFSANPPLLDLVVGGTASAPRLAAYLGRRPQMLDALLDRDFWSPMPDAATLTAMHTAVLAQEDDYERCLDAARRWAREQWFRAGSHVLRGMADQIEAGRAFSSVAEACLAALMPRIVAEFASRHGPPPGRGIAVIAMGRLGSAEMTAQSDLDLITVYDADGAETSDGPRPLPVATYFPRLTQAIVAALTAPTAEGTLYEVDMRLRPSGRQGPVAVSIASFEKYQTERAWVWEHMALTRARVISGDPVLAARIEAVIAEALARRAQRPEVLDQASEMLARIVDGHRAERSAIWTLKHPAGGLMEIEFLAQAGALYHGLAGRRTVPDIMPGLAETGWLAAADAARLVEAYGLMSRIHQIARVALDDAIDPARTGAALRAVLVEATGAPDFDGLERDLRSAQRDAAAIVVARLPRPDEPSGPADPGGTG